VVPDLSVAHHELGPEFDLSPIIPDRFVVQSAEYDPLRVVAARDADPHPLADAGGRVRELDLYVVAGS
jgi:hypothetical protein